MKSTRKNVTKKGMENKNIPNALTAKTIKDARNGIGLEGPIKSVDEFLKSI